MDANRKQLHDLLDSLLIKTTLIEHPEVFTVEAMLPYLGGCKGLVTKNLFVKGKKKKDLWLITVGHDKCVNLADLGKELSAGGFRFADESVLQHKLGVKQGCVTPFALMNDSSKDVQLVLDCDVQSLPEGELVYGHPMVNNATIGISPRDLLKFLEHIGHEPKFAKLARTPQS